MAEPVTDTSASEVERKLRAYAASVRVLRGLHYRGLSGRERFWEEATTTAIARTLDRAGDCQRVAAELAERCGLGIVVGWCFDFDGRVCWHCANFTRDGLLVDAGRERHRPGFLGKLLNEREASLIVRAASQPTPEELRERFGSLGRGLAALFG